MARKLEPIIGEWYRDHGEQRVFEVLALDDDDGKIDIQYADGDVLVLNQESWRDLMLTMAPPPESGSFRGGAEFESDLDSATLPTDDWRDNHDNFDSLGSDDEA